MTFPNFLNFLKKLFSEESIKYYEIRIDKDGKAYIIEEGYIDLTS